MSFLEDYLLSRCTRPRKWKRNKKVHVSRGVPWKGNPKYRFQGVKDPEDKKGGIYAKEVRILVGLLIL